MSIGAALSPPAIVLILVDMASSAVGAECRLRAVTAKGVTGVDRASTLPGGPSKVIALFMEGAVDAVGDGGDMWLGAVGADVSMSAHWEGRTWLGERQRDDTATDGWLTVSTAITHQNWVTPVAIGGVQGPGAIWEELPAPPASSSGTTRGLALPSTDTVMGTMVVRLSCCGVTPSTHTRTGEDT